MASADICRSFLRKVWRPYDVSTVPEEEGIYAIGLEGRNGLIFYIYIGETINLRNRLGGHKSGQVQEIDKVLRQQFDENGGVNLKIKWVEEKKHKCVEQAYINCVIEKLGYSPEYNMKRGNTC